MLTRFKIHRGKRPPDEPLPDGIRQDTRFRTRHVLAPTKTMVEAYLSTQSERAWSTFRKAYLLLLSERFAADRSRFDQLANIATDQDVFLGCSCPTKKNPRIDRCHTWLALSFMKQMYPAIEVRSPERA